MKHKKHIILYVCNFLEGLRDFFLKGQIDEGFIQNMPAFYYPFMEILNSPQVERIVMLLIYRGHPPKSINIPKKYSGKLFIYPVKVQTSFELFIKLPYILVKALYLIGKYKVTKIYDHSNLGILSWILSFISRKPCIRRLYGTFLVKDIHLPKFFIFFKHPFSYLTFCLPAQALIITNDGTKGDKVFEKIGNKKTKLYFLLNGVDKNLNDKLKEPKGIKIPTKYITYIARFDRWKRQDLVIKALKTVMDNYPQFNTPLFMIGPITDREFFKEVEGLVRSNNLDQVIHIIPGLHRNEAMFMLKNSYLTLSLYEISNLGNVFLESLLLGVPIIAINNSSLELFPKNIYYEVKSPDPEEIAEAVIDLLVNPQKRDTIARNALQFAEKNLASWRERSKLELDIILS